MEIKELANNSLYLQFVSVLNDSNFDIAKENIPSPKILQEGNDSSAVLGRMHGCLLGLAVGDAVGGPYEFESRQMRVKKPAYKMSSGGGHNLLKGEWTDDTSMALCLAASLICKGRNSLYDQLMRYNWWRLNGYLSSRHQCFDIGNITHYALMVFNDRKSRVLALLKCDDDLKITDEILKQNNVLLNCGSQYGGRKAGNGALMRLAPIPLFFHGLTRAGLAAAEESCLVTHDDPEAADACKLYTAMIMGALDGLSKDAVLHKDFFQQYTAQTLVATNIVAIASGSYKVNGDEDISGSGYVVHSLKAALWALYNDECSFEKGVFLAINLGDDTDTTAAIYGQLAGALYGVDGIPKKWRDDVLYASSITTMADWLFVCNEILRKENNDGRQ